jgi:hypothetical protein
VKLRRIFNPLLILVAGIVQGQPPEHAVVDGPVHNGVAVTVDLPSSQHVKNFGAPKDGSGLCVFASLDMAARWHACRHLVDVIHKVDEGGGWPQKVDRVLKEVDPDTRYLQYEGTSPEILDKAMEARRPVCVTYGYGERYGGKTIYHMVLLVHLDDKTAAVLDNNFPGTFEWMSRAEFLNRWKHPGDKAWAVTLLEPPPPPIPSRRDDQ